MLKITALCIATAMICAALRVQRPELATAVSLAGGIAALAMAWSQMAGAGALLKSFRQLLGQDDDVTAVILKGAGIAIGDPAVHGRRGKGAGGANRSGCAPGDAGAVRANALPNHGLDH